MTNCRVSVPPIVRYGLGSLCFVIVLAALFITDGYSLAHADSAVTMDVSTTLDTLNATDGLCSLREAVVAANANAASGTVPGECPAGGNTYPDTILLDPGVYSLTRKVGEGDDDDDDFFDRVGDLDTVGRLVIRGSGPGVTVIDASALEHRIFQVYFGGLTLENLTLRGGGHRNRGGAIYNFWNVTLTNVTLTGNSANASGGAIYNWGTVNLSHITFVNNQAPQGGAAIHNSSGTVNIGGSLIVGPPGSCLGTLTTTAPNATTDAGCAIGATYTEAALLLQTQNDDGGLPQLYAPQPGSPLINAVDPALYTCPATDQVGTTRPQGTGCDIGAYEQANLNQPPHTAGDSYATNEDTPLTVAAPGLLGNDSDPNLDPLTVISYTQPANGAVAVQPDGSFVYTPTHNYEGADTFLYTASDGVFTSANTAVTLTVAADAIYEVTNVDDSGPGSLRAAIERANSTPGPNTIIFEIPGAGPHVIGLLSGYTLSDVAFVDGTTDAEGVVLDGRRDQGGNFTCLTLLAGAGGSTIQGLTIRNCGQDGILLQQSGGNTITGNTITNNGGSGVNIAGDGTSEESAIATGSNTITGNTITNNGGAGIKITNSVNNLIANNNISGNGGGSIDLGGDGPTPNDPNDEDGGANFVQNFPVLYRATPEVSDTSEIASLRVVGSLNSKPGIYTIQFFASPNCDSGDLTLLNTDTYTVSIAPGTNDVSVHVGIGVTTDYLNYVVRATATDANHNTSEFSDCIRVSDDNDIWPEAMDLGLTPGGGSAAPVSAATVNAPTVSAAGSNTVTVSQYLDQLGQSRWFKFQIAPNSQIKIELTDLPANYDLLVYKDIEAAYDELANDPLNLNKLGAQFAADPVNPSALAQDAFRTVSVSGSALNGSALNGSALNGSALNGSALNGSALNGSALNGSALNGSALNGSALNGSALNGSALNALVINGSALNGSALNGSALNAEEIARIYSAAHLQSLIAVSAFDDKAPESIQLNTWNNTGWYYVRVAGREGAFDPNNPFTLTVTVNTGICDALFDAAGELPPTNIAIQDAEFQTIILVDWPRMTTKYGEAAVNSLKAKLAQLAANASVNGVVVDVSLDARVAAANLLAGPADPPEPVDPDTAGSHPACPYAKNLVAQSIKQIVDGYAQVNPLKYVVLIGNDDVIPFFRYPDNALLGPESNYVVPVESTSASEAALRTNYLLSQDAYGSRLSISLKDNSFPLPGMPVGRLVETPAQITTVVDAYLNGGEVIVPQSALVTGYDFLEDAANAISGEFSQTVGVGGSVDDDLIDPQDLAHLVDPNADPWTAQQLIDKLQATDYDIAFLAGHFAAASALAGDYRTSMVTTDLLASPVDFTNALFFSAGCHSGYNTVTEHNEVYTLSPDWAEAFATKGATLIAGTGYQYGDTEFLEFSERLYLYFLRKLREGNGPVAIGDALVAAKQQYLASTPALRSIHEKTLLVATIFGLPMKKVNLPGNRTDPQGGPSVVGATTAAPAPGAAIGLQTFDLNVPTPLDPQTDRRFAELTSIADYATKSFAFWWEDPVFGVVTNPGEPVVPLEVVNVTAPTPSIALRGVGFRGGCYTDINKLSVDGVDQPIHPLTGAPTTELSSVHVTFLSEIFVPVQPWAENYFAPLTQNGGATLLNVLPTQYKTEFGAGGQQSNLERTFSEMNFRLYYSGSQGTPNLVSRPTMVSVGSVYSPTIDSVLLQVKVLGAPNADIQEVWVVYTSPAAMGSGPCAGKRAWQPLYLTRNSDDPMAWEGTLPLNGVPPGDVRFLAEAANAYGLVSWANNLGRFYTPGGDIARTGTKLALDPLPSPSGQIGNKVTFSAVLRNAETDAPLANQMVAVGLAQQSRVALTDGDGRATVEIPILGAPGEYIVTAWFNGTTALAPSTAEAALPFTIIQQQTQTTLGLASAPSAAAAAPAEPPYVVTLLDGAGNPLVEQTIFYILTNVKTHETIIKVVITGLFGEAPLGRVELPPGQYQIQASFKGTASYAPSDSAQVDYLLNSSPTAADDTYSMDEDQTLDVAAPGVQVNDSDPDGEALATAATAQPAHGTLTLQTNGAFSYTPAANFFGYDGFGYLVCDLHDLCAAATVTLTVKPVNDAPVAQNDVAAVNEDGSVNIAVLTNDHDADLNLAADSLSMTVNPAHGGAVVQNGQIVYTPAANYHGSDGLAYQVCDAGGLCTAATVAITVNPVNDPPVCTDVVAAPITIWPLQHQFVTVAVQGVTDVDGDDITIRYSGIFQDEPVGTDENRPDANLRDQCLVAEVRAERDSEGDGRVYHLGYVALDNQGGSCTGTVRMPTVPVEQAGVVDSIDGGALFDSRGEGAPACGPLTIPTGNDLEPVVYLPFMLGR